MTPRSEEDARFDYYRRIDVATDLLLKSMEQYDSQACRTFVSDALYILVEGDKRES